MVLATRSGDLEVWDVDSDGRHLYTLKGHRSSVKAVVVSPDGRQAVSGSADNTLKVWDLTSGREVGEAEGSRAGGPGSGDDAGWKESGVGIS